MTTEVTSDRAAKRRDALSRLHSQRGNRMIPRPLAGFEDEAETPKLDPFLRRSESTGGPMGNRLSPTDVKQFLRASRQDRHASETPGDQPTPESLAGTLGAWQELLAEVGAGNLTDNFSRWLGGVSPQFGISSTPTEELVALREQIRLREKALEALLKLTHHELEELEVQIASQSAWDAKNGS